MKDTLLKYYLLYLQNINTRSSVGLSAAWREATPEARGRIQEVVWTVRRKAAKVKTTLLRDYISFIRGQTALASSIYTRFWFKKYSARKSINSILNPIRSKRSR